MDEATQDVPADAATRPGPAAGAPASSPAPADVPASSDASAASGDAPAPRRKRTLARDLTALAVVGVLLVGALGTTAVLAYRDLYSPTAFVTRYLSLLSEGRAAEALQLPGVAVDSSQLTAAGLPSDASEALLRRDALAPLTGIAGVSEKQRDGVTEVTVSYSAGPHPATSTFTVAQTGWIGVAPAWRFAQSPLAAIELTVRGATKFAVNGFDIDTRQVAAAGVEADPLDPVPLLVFSPGLYSITVDTAVSTSPGVAVLSDTPQADIPVDLQTEPTEEFVGVVQDEVDAFLTDCATQEVLQPTGCPFGLVVQNRIVSAPTWSIAKQPTITLAPDGANWAIPRTEGVAHIEVDIQSIYDGSIRHLDEDVPFVMTGTVTILPDGTASIAITEDS